MEDRVTLTVFSLFLFALTVSATTYNFDYIVVGAGPSGVESGYFLERANRSYVLLERGPTAASFFTKYPRHDTLISINKRHTGQKNKEFNLRHDWNSILSDDDSLLFGNYDKNFFPNRKNLVKYINDYVRRWGINIRHNTDVRNIRHYSDDSGKGYKYTLNDQHGNTYFCKTLIVATGTWEPEVPTFPGSEHVLGYESFSVDPADFEGKSVMILGRGNAAFETADRIYGVTNVVHMVGRSRVKMAWSSHYVGDIRAINAQLLDTYQLKSLDAVVEININNIAIVKNGSKFYPDYRSIERGSYTERFDNFAFRDGYDYVLRALGFKFNFSLFDSSMGFTKSGDGRLTKYPKINFNYESSDHKDLFFAGSSTHSLDYRKSSGGFIHGFRYTARALHKLLEWKNEGMKWASTSHTLDDLQNNLVKRVNEASGLYEMFGSLGDVIVLGENSFEYLEEFPTNLLHEFTKYSGHEVESGRGILVLTLEYGPHYSGPVKDVFYYQRATQDPATAHHSSSIHPVINYYKTLPTAAAMAARDFKISMPRPDLVHHIVEDLTTHFQAPHNHILPLRRFLEQVLNTDMRRFYAEECLRLAMTVQELPQSCKSQLNHGSFIGAVENGFEFLHSTVASNA